jgi:prepilin-type processing-associated H-X9-DG protein
MMRVIFALAILFAVIALVQREDRRSSRMQGASGHCASNIHNVVLGVLGYVNVNGVFPTGSWPNPDLDPEDRLSWYAQILPQIDNQDVYDTLEKDQAWSDPQNNVVSFQKISYLCCQNRAAVPPGSPQPASYVGIAGLGVDAAILPKAHARAGVFGYDRRTTLADITDGAANTLLIAETAIARGSWLQGGFATVRGLDPARKPYIGAGRQFGGLHGGGAWVAMADGSVRSVDETISPQIFEALSTMAGGERLPKDW